jgi:integration host factor subunit alpha
MEKTITRAYLADKINKALFMTHDEAAELNQAIIDTLKKSILTHNEVKISNFGTFRVYKKKERIGRNPKTMEEAVISPRKSIHFRSATKLKEAINTPKKK